MLKRKLYYAIPQSFRPIVRKIYYLPYDLLQSLKGTNELAPPKGDVFVGNGDFTEQGLLFLDYFKDLTHLQPNHTVLDVGCGIGRMAVPFLDFLDDKGEYHGFDIVQKGIDWCTKNISSRNPNFHFKQVDIHNKLYNVKGKLKGEDFTFPYESEKFDFIFLTSVFTHMMPPEVENYLSEISRVLKKGGQCFITYFVLDADATQNMNSGKSDMVFKYKKEFYSLIDEKVDTANIAFQKDYLMHLYKKNNLKISQETIYDGWWSGKPKKYNFQDILVAEKV